MIHDGAHEFSLIGNPFELPKIEVAAHLPDAPHVR